MQGKKLIYSDLVCKKNHSLTTFSFYSPNRATHDIVNVWPLEAIESGRSRHSVGSHVVKDQPVAHLQVRQLALLNNTVEPITGWAPDTAGVHDLIRLWLLFTETIGREKTTTLLQLSLGYILDTFQSINFTYLMQCRQTLSMVKEYTVKRSINAIVDIVHQCSVIGSFIFLCEESRNFSTKKF